MLSSILNWHEKRGLIYGDLHFAAGNINSFMKHNLYVEVELYCEFESVRPSRLISTEKWFDCTRTIFITEMKCHSDSACTMHAGTINIIISPIPVLAATKVNKPI